MPTGVHDCGTEGLQGVHDYGIDGLQGVRIEGFQGVHDWGIESPREVHMVRYDFHRRQGFEEIFVDGILEPVAC